MRCLTITFLFLSLVLVTACIKKKNYPITPVIEFTSIAQNTTEKYATIVISFKDGDGDLGQSEDDATLGVYIKYLYKDVNGVYQSMDTSLLNPVYDTLIDTYLIDLAITPQGKNKAVEGDFIIKKDYPLYYKGHPFIPKPSAVKYEIWIIDRAKHVSNRVETSEIDVTGL